ncbi:MAG: DJ-1/PfpI family protein [Candidatus Izimaplasma sp.]|nr:DJ-1/PfpI family protein [Candidatus Izimaplasma bacterium]
MKKILVLLADGFEDIEVVTPTDLLRRAKIKVDLVSIDKRLVTTSSGTEIMSDMTIDTIDENQYDMLFLPGGSGVKNLEKSSEVKKLITYFDQTKKFIAAICAAPSILGKMGLLKNRTFTCYPGYEKQFNQGNYTKSPLEISDYFITARGIGYVNKFALQLIEILTDKRTKNKVAKQTLILESGEFDD